MHPLNCISIYSFFLGVDPLAAERIVRYLKELKPSQGLLFASHRIDECISTCNRVLMLVEGNVYFDGSVHAFDQLASLFYQIDLVLPTTIPPSPSPSTPSSTSSTPSASSLQTNIFSSKVDEISSSLPPPLSPHLPALHSIVNQVQIVSNEDQNRERESSSDNVAKISPPFLSPTERVMFKISERCGGLELVERIVEYSPTLVRVTFEKRLVPLTKIWNILGDLRRENVLEKYSFRTMGMEEALATIIASSKGL